MNLAFRFITALTFAVPATVFAWWAVDRQSPDIWRWVPLSAGIGAFLTTVVVWPWLARDEGRLTRGGLAGGVIGLVSHPITAVISITLISLFKVLHLLPPRPPGATPWPSNWVDMLGFAGFWIFWWTVVAMLGVGWITAGIGAVIGCICAAWRRLIDRCNLQKSSTPSSQLAAPGLSLLIVVSVSGFIFALLMMQRTAQTSPDVVFEKSAHIDHNELLRNPGDVTAEIVAGATLVSRGDFNSDLDWTFTEHEFTITVGDSGLPPDLMYEFQLSDANIHRLQGTWSIDGQLLQLSDIRVDGQPANIPELTLFASFKTGQLRILVGGEYLFHTNHDKD